MVEYLSFDSSDSSSVSLSFSWVISYGIERRGLEFSVFWDMLFNRISYVSESSELLFVTLLSIPLIITLLPSMSSTAKSMAYLRFLGLSNFSSEVHYFLSMWLNLLFAITTSPSFPLDSLWLPFLNDDNLSSPTYVTEKF